MQRSNKAVLFAPLLLAGALLAGLFYGLAPTALAAGPWYVDAAGGYDGNDCLSPASACATVAAAIALASSGDTIHIASGIYEEHLIVTTKDLNFVGAGPTETFLDGGGAGRVLYAYQVAVSLNGLTIQNGYEDDASGGAAIYAREAELNLDNVVLSHNISERGAGALYFNDLFETGAVLTMTDTLLEQNEGQHGGALRLSGATGFLHNVTIANNHTTTADNGALNLAGGDVTLTNVTVSGNSAAGIHITNFGSITMTNSTIAQNESFGLSTYGSGLIQNTIFAENNDGNSNCFLYQTAWNDSLGHNLDDGDSCGFDQVGDQVNTDPQLQPLADSGGVLTHALVAGSPALDAADDAACPATDQRGITRPQDGDGDSTAVCDIGAFEFVEMPVGDVTVSGPSEGFSNSAYTFQAQVTPTTAAQPVTYTWEATGQTPVTQQGSATDMVMFSWSDAGAKTVTVNADNGYGQATTAHTITIESGVVPLTGVTVSGPAEGVRDQVYTFTAAVAPGSATLPVTYTWQIDGRETIVHMGGGISDQVAVSWDVDGVYDVSVTADNGHGQAGDTHTITLSAWYVDTANGDDGNDCQSPATACQTIQAAVERAPAGATVHIAAGLYLENVMVDHPLQLIGAGASNTILDGDGSGTVLTVDLPGLGSFDASLQGVTLQHGETGLYNSERLTVVDSVIRFNQSDGAAAGVFNGGVLEMSDSAIFSNTAASGAGLFNSGVARLNGVTIHGNASENTTAVHTQGSGETTLTNVTASDNRGGAAIVSTGGSTVTLLNSTVAHNDGSAFGNFATLRVQNSIVAHNGERNCWSAMTSLGNNLEDDDTCGFDRATDIVNSDPLLQELAHAGGPTATHRPLTQSPALDAANGDACPATDQRGVARPQDGDGDGQAACDIGAVELAPHDLLHAVHLPLLLR